MPKGLKLLCAWLVLAAGARGVAGLDDEHRAIAKDAIQRGIAFLRGSQNDDGSWSPKPGPAITGLVATSMIDQPDIGRGDPAVRQALEYILSKRRDDGSIHDGILQNYNTSICLSALARVAHLPDMESIVHEAQSYLRQSQWAGQTDPQGRPVDRAHPFYGGAGYGRHGRPDLSNTHVMLQGLRDSGLPADDPAYQRALVFIARCQGTAANDLFAGQIVSDGGFIYSTSIDKTLIGVPQSMASPHLVDEARAGRAVSGLRTYGTMTYAGFKSYLYAALDRNDPRVRDAFEWVRRNYTLERNPGLPEALKMQGYYYYLMVFARALRAWGDETITTANGAAHDWANELIARLAAIQRPDGSWLNEADRWMEGDVNLVTGYALTALNEALKEKADSESGGSGQNHAR